MGGSIPGLGSGLSGLGNILSGIGSATGGGSGGSGSAGGTNPNNPNQPNQQQYNFLTDPAVLAQFSMDQGQNPPQQQPPIPPQPTFSDTNFFSPQQTMPYSGQKPPQQPAPGPQWNPNYGGGQQTQATPAPAPVEIPSEQPQGPSGYYSGGQQTQETPAPAPTDIPATTTAPVGNAPTTDGGGGGGGGGGGNIAKTGADVARRIGRATAGTQQPSYYPDIAGSARESGGGPPNAFTPQAGGPAVNPLQAISNLLNQAFGGGLQGMTQQAGPAYGTVPPATPPPATPTPSSATSNVPATAAAQAADAMAPGSAAAAVVAGARGAQGQPATVPQGAGRPPLVLRDPSDPSKGYMPDPNYAKPGSTGENQSHTGGPPGDRPAPGNANQSQNYIEQHGGYSQSGYGHRRGNFGNVALNPEFSNRLTNAGRAYEQETGRQPQYGLGDRDIATQQYYWDDSRHGTRYAAAPPGRSLHQRGLAMDMPPNSEFTHWLLANNGANAHRFGLSNPVPHDTFHVQMQDLRGRAYPYAAAPVEANFHAAGGQQAATESVGQGVIPGSQQPAGTRGADVNYQPRDYQRALFQIESGGNINAPRTGSNRGIAQFGRAEERRFGITNRRDINQEARGVQREATENTQHLQQAGVAADPANLYLLHQQGQAGGTALLQADANTPAYQVLRRFYGSDALAQRAIHGNIPSDNPLHNTPAEQITAGQFRDMWRTRFNEQMGNQSQAEGGTQLAGDVVPYVREYKLPQIHGPLDQLIQRFPHWFVPQGGETIKNWIDKPANQAQTQMPIQLAGELTPSIANMIEQQNQGMTPFNVRQGTPLFSETHPYTGMPKFSPPPPTTNTIRRREGVKQIEDRASLLAQLFGNYAPIGKVGSVFRNVLSSGEKIGKDFAVRSQGEEYVP